MAKISSYPILSNPTINDILIGTDVEDLNITKNFSIGSIIDIIGNEFVPYVGATGNVNLGAFNITSTSFIVAGGSASQFLKANGTLDSTVYVPASRTLTINSVTYDLSANRSWDLNTIDTLTTIGTSGAATYIGKTLNIPQYQAQGSYITQLSGEATAVGPGNATVTLSNLAVISKILTGLNITGGTVTDTDSILTAFGKVQNQINGLAGGVTYQGTWNAATNTPTLTSSVGTKGFYYVVSVPGSTNLNGITDWKLGDWAIFNGSTWEKVDNTDAVVSVNGYTGAVVLTFSDVGAPPATRTLSINGTTFDLTANRSWTVGDVRTDQTYSNPTWISTLAWGKITGTPTTLAGYGITDGASNTTTLTINGTTFDLSANRTWNVGTVTSVGTSGPLTGGTITGSGTIGITQAGASSDGYLSSTDWNTFNNKQNALTNPVTGTGTIFTLPMWSGATSLVDSPLSYGPDTFNFQYNSATGGTVNFTNIGLTAYTYSIQMNNFGSPRSTVHSYTDGVVVQSIGGTQVSRVFANGNTILGAGVVDNGYKLEVSGNLYVNSIVNATTDTDRFIVSDGGLIKYRTGAQLLSDIGAQGALTLTTTGTSGAATLIGNVLNIPQYTDQFVGTVTSVGLSMPPAFTVSNSPVTSAGTLTVLGAGNATQYVRGDGALATLPTSGTGGGASVSYYLNGSVNQGTIGGVTYYEMNRTPIIGTGTDFTRNTNGYIASFLTDAGDPALLAIPAGNWNFETYFEASSGGGSPTFYLELYKYDGTTFTLIASNSGSPKLINDATNIEAYFSALAVPQTTLTLTDRLSIRIYVTTAGRTITLHTENNTLCQVITTFTTGLTALNGLTSQVQYFATGTSGTDFNILSAVDTHTFNLPTASAVNRGALSAADWSTFNAKMPAITFNAPLFIASGGDVGITQASGSTNGFLSSTDWNTFNNKQNALTNPVTGTGTTNVVPKFTGTSTIGDSSIADNTNEVNITKRLFLNTGGQSILLTPNLGGSVNRIESSNLPLEIFTSGSELRLAAGGVSTQITLLSSGNVGIGTTTPDAQLVLNGSSNSRFNMRAANTRYGTLYADNGVFAVASITAIPLVLGTNDIERARITSGGNLLVGTTTDNGQRLQVNGAGGIRINEDGSSTKVISIRSDFAGVDPAVNVVTNNSLLLMTSNTERMRITSGGNVGIGVIPSAWRTAERALQIGPTTSVTDVSNFAVFRNNNFVNSSGQEIYITTNGASALVLAPNSEYRFLQAPVGTAGNVVSFTQPMTITSGGNVGIGTTSPQTAGGGYTGLHINGNGASLVLSTNGSNLAYLYTSGTGGADFRIENPGAQIFSPGGNERMRITAAGNVGIGTTSPVNNANRNTLALQGAWGGQLDIMVGSTVHAQFGTDNFNSGLSCRIQSQDGIVFNSGGATERMRITSGGNVGIGTSSPSRKLTVSNAANGDIALFTNTADADLLINLTSGVTLLTPTTGILAFGTSNTERMRITSSGNVLIGTTTDAGFKLDVNGTGRFSGNTTGAIATFINTNTAGTGNGLLVDVNSQLGTDNYVMNLITNGTSRMYVREDGLVFMSGLISSFTTGNAANMFVSSGDGAIYRSTSSIKYKRNVKNYEKGLKEVLNLRPVTYEGLGKIDSNKTFAGLIAEEVHELGLNEFVQYAEDGTPDALGYQNMIALLTKAIQELKQEIDTLKK
jgi:hypothetical protein